jgi:hypothetical protein
MMYRWMVYAHIAGVLGFFMMQGATISVMIRLRREVDAERIAALLSLQESAARRSIPPLLVILLSGTTLGFMGRWWGDAWIWIALGLFMLMSILGFGLSRSYGQRIRANLQVNAGNPSVTTSFVSGLSPDQIEPLLATGHAGFLSVTSGGSLMLLLWLMIFKPC